MHKHALEAEYLVVKKMRPTKDWFASERNRGKLADREAPAKQGEAPKVFIRQHRVRYSDEERAVRTKWLTQKST